MNFRLIVIGEYFSYFPMCLYVCSCVNACQCICIKRIATQCGQQITQSKNSTKRLSFLKALQKDVLNLCPLSNQDAPNAFVEPRRTKCSNVRSGVEDTSCEGHLTYFFRRIVLARNQKNNFFYENRESTWEGHGGTIMEAEQLKTRKYVPIVSNNHIISYNINCAK